MRSEKCSVCGKNKNNESASFTIADLLFDGSIKNLFITETKPEVEFNCGTRLQLTDCSSCNLSAVKKFLAI